MPEPISSTTTTTDGAPAGGGEQTDPAGSSDSSTTPPESTDTGKPDSGAGEEELGAGGLKALEAERQARRDAEKARKALEAELEEVRKSQLSESDKALEERYAAGKAEALAEVTERLVRAEARAAAGGKLADPADAELYLGKLDDYVDEDGEPDRSAIAAAIDKLVTERPYLAAPSATDGKETPPPPPATGGVPGGATGDPAPTSFKRSQLTPEFMAANREAIRKAHAEGRIIDDIDG